MEVHSDGIIVERLGIDHSALLEELGGLERLQTRTSTQRSLWACLPFNTECCLFDRSFATARIGSNGCSEPVMHHRVVAVQLYSNTEGAVLSILLLDPYLLTTFALSRLHLPYLQLIRTSIAQPRVHIKRPTMSRACDSRTEDNAKVFDVVQTASR